MTIYLTSFKAYWEGEDDVCTYTYKMPAFSIAVYQPKWYWNLEPLRLFDIRDRGRWIRPRDFITEEASTAPDHELLLRYHLKLYSMYTERWDRQPEYEQKAFLRRVQSQDEAWCCWCPYDKAAKRQLDTYGSFVCHSWVVETFLKTLGVDVQRDEDRERMVRL
jgi:hypothetical protein